MSRSFRVIDGCPCPTLIAPYVYMVLRQAGQGANSIYRGEDAKAILHAHGKHTQAELYATLPPGQANPPGFSTHELKSDGRAYPSVPRGGQLEDWQEGVDSGSNTPADVAAIQAAGRHFGWEVFHPYAAGVEEHHWNMKTRPRPRGWQRVHILHLRASLPRR